MKKCPQKIKKMLKDLQKSGWRGYLVGKSLEALILGGKIEKWEVLINKECKNIEQFFPEEMRFEVIFFEGDINEYLKKQLFTIDAVAFDGGSFLDPYAGQMDIENQCLRMCSDPQSVFEKKPVAILEAIEKAANTGYEADQEIRKSIRSCCELLKGIQKRDLTLWFQNIMIAPHAGKALRLMDECGMISIIVGDQIYRHRNKKEIAAFQKYMEKIDQTLPILERRIVSFYLGFWKGNDSKAMANLEYDEDLREKLDFAHSHLSDLYYIHRPIDLKNYLYKYGLKRYTFLDNISKIQTKVYGLDSKPIEVRQAVFKRIAAQNEPVFLEDLSMNTEVLLREGLAKDRTAAEKLLELLLYVVHRHPDYNDPQRLLSQAYRLNRNPMKRFYYRCYSRKL